ncbi:CAP domain-containing protein [Roseiflexus sp.]|uniref:CAP domain-containing protein n=1 Tax=Roseiflexus sp. TaxID=2562120 RepID=UPI00398AB259
MIPTCHRSTHILLLVILPLIGALISPNWLYGMAVAGQPSHHEVGEIDLPDAPSYTVHLPLIARSEKWPAMNRDFELRFIALLNEERARHGLGPLAEEPCLVAAARRHARDIAVNRFISHVGSDGSLPHERALQEGCVWGQFGGEVAGNAVATPETAVAAFLNSPPHRALLLQESVTRIGVGLYPNRDDSTYAIVGVPGHPSLPPAHEVEAAFIARLAAHRTAHGAPPLTRNAALDRVAQRAFQWLDASNRESGYRNFCSSPFFIRYSDTLDWAAQEGYSGTVNMYHPIHAACIYDILGATAEDVMDRLWAFAAQRTGHFSLMQLADPAQQGAGIAVAPAYYGSYMIVIVTGDTP